MLVSILLLLVVVFVGAVVMWGYPALIVGLLLSVALVFVAILAMTADGLFPQKTGLGH